MCVAWCETNKFIKMPSSSKMRRMCRLKGIIPVYYRTHASRCVHTRIRHQHQHSSRKQSRAEQNRAEQFSKPKSSTSYIHKRAHAHAHTHTGAHKYTMRTATHHVHRFRSVYFSLSSVYFYCCCCCCFFYYDRCVFLIKFWNFHRVLHLTTLQLQYQLIFNWNNKKNNE